MKIAVLSVLVGTIGLLAGCTSNPTNTPGESDQTPAITSFGANPNPVPVNIASQFSWSLTGEGLTCQLDVDDNGTIDYTVQNCTSTSRLSHQYAELGKYTARLSVTSAGGVVLSETTPVEVGAANQAPNPVLKVGVGGQTDQPLAVKFSWTVTDSNSDVTRCQLDADGDGRWEYDALCSGLTAQRVGPSDQASYFYTHVYSQVGKYSAVLLASDAYQGNESRVEVRVPLNRAPVIEDLEATVESGRLKVRYRVSDPDLDPVACVVKIEGIGRFAYDDCRSPIQTYPTAGKNQFDITLEASDPYQTTLGSLKYEGSRCKSLQASDWSNNMGPEPELPSQVFGQSDSSEGLYTALAISPDCRLVVVATVSGQLKMWNYGNFDVEPVVFGEASGGPNFIERLIFSPDSRHLVATGCIISGLVMDVPTQASVWDLVGETPRRLSTSFTDQIICSSAYSPDGSTLALGTFGLGGSGKIYLMRGDRPSQVKGELEMDGSVMALAYSPNGNVLAASDVQFAPPSVQDPPIEIPSLPGLARLKALNGGLKSTQDLVLLFGITVLKLYDGRNPIVPNFSEVFPPVFLGGSVVNVLEFSPDGTYLAGSALSFIYSAPWLISMQDDTPQDFLFVNLPAPFTVLTGSLSISPDSQWIAVPSYLGAVPTLMYSLRSQSVEGVFSSGFFNVFSPDNRQLFGGPSEETGAALSIFSR